MNKLYSRIDWKNEPNTTTPLNEVNLNKMDSALNEIDNRIIEQDTSKLDKSTAYTMVKDISFNENNGIFTVTRLNGSTFTIDTRLEKIAINFKYDYSTQKLIVTLIDGTTQSIDMSALLTQYEFTDSATLDFTTDSNGKVTATIKSGSITEDMLQPNYLAEIKVETEKSAQSMANAKISENNAKQSELNAKASEEQALEYSNNAQPLAQSVSGNNPTATNSTDGNIIYLNNKGYTQQDGTPSPDNPIRIGGLADKGYFDGQLVLNSDVLENAISNKNPFTCKAGDVIKVIYEDVVDNFSMRLIDTDGRAWSYNLSNVNVMEWSAPKDAQEVYFYIKDDTISSVADAKHITVTINGQYAVRVKTCGKNLLKNTATSTTINGLTFKVNDDGSVNASGTCTNYTDIKIGEFKPKIGERYTFTSETENVTNKYNCNARNINGSSSWRFDGYTFEATTEDVVRVYATIYADATLTNYNVKPMIRLASDTDATYEPHQETEALIPVSAPFYNGDYIEVYADGSGREYRVMGSKVFDGSESYTQSSSEYMSENIYSVFTSISDMKQKSALKCTHFANVFDTSKNYVYCAFGNTVIFGIDKALASNVNAFKTWLQSNPMTVVYELATPTVTPLTAEQVAGFMKLQTFKGVTHVTADGEVVMRYYCDNASGETVSMLQSSLPQTYSREFEWLSPKLGHVQYFDFYFDKSYSKPPIVIPAVRGAGAQGIIPHVSYVNEEKCSITLYNAVDYSSNTMPVIVGGNVDILVY